MRTKIFISIIVFSFIITEYYLLRCYNSLKENLQVKNDLIAKLVTENLGLKPQFEIWTKNCGKKLEGNILLTDANSNCFSLSNIVQKQTRTLICRFSDSDCMECVKYAVDDLIKQKDVFDLSNVIFIGNCMGNSIFRLRIKELNLENNNVYNCSSLKIPADSLSFPYYMVIDNSLKIYSVYFPNKYTSVTNMENLKLMYENLVK